MSRKGLMSNYALESEKPMPVNDTDGQNTDTQMNPDPADQSKPKEIDAVELNKIQEDIVAIESEANQSQSDAVQITNALGVSESLGNGMELLSDMMEEGKLTPMSVKVMDIATESVCLSIGLNPGNRIAMENDNVMGKDEVDTSKMKEAGQGLLKKMATKLKEILQAIIKMIKHSIQSGKAWFQRVFSSVEQLKTKFSELAKQTSSWGTVEGHEFTNSHSVSMLSKGTTAGDPATVARNLSELATYNETLLKSGFSEAVQNAVSAIADMYKNKGRTMFAYRGEKTKEDQFREAEARLVKSAANTTYQALRMNNHQGQDTTGPELIGNVAIVSKNDITRMVQTSYYSASLYNGNHFGLVDTENAKRNDESLPVLDSSGAKALLDAAYKALNAASAYKKLSDEQVKVKQQMADLLEKLTDDVLQIHGPAGMGIAGATNNAKYNDSVPAMQALMNFFMRMIDQLPQLLEGHTVKVLFAALNWLNHSAKVQGGLSKAKQNIVDSQTVAA